MKQCYVLILFILLLGITLFGKPRKWTLSSGKQFTADITGVQGNKIAFQRSDGKKRTIAINKLNKKDILYFYINVLKIPSYSSYRTWTQKKPSRKIKAKLFAVDTKKVYLKTPKGKKKALTLTTLSGKDRAYISKTISDATMVFGLDEQKDDVVEKQKAHQNQFNQQFPGAANNQFAARRKPPTGLMALAGAGIIVMLVLNALLYTFFLWISKMLTGCKTSFFALLVSSIISGIISMIPVVGLFLPGIIQILVVMKISKTEFIDTLFMVVIANFLFVMTSFVALAKMMTMMGF